MINTHNSINTTLNALDLIAERHKALSSNLANMDTPNYKRKDISFSQYLGGANPLETKLASVMGPSPVMIDTLNERVDPANELSEMQKNSILYTIASRRMSNIITEMKTVINVGS
ncbi:MAG: flagellar basal body rod protein FlgB [Candidatus Avigastranaerophilus sp.]